MSGEPHPAGHSSRPRSPHGLRSLMPALLAVLAIGGIYLLVSAPLSPGPPGLLLLLIGVLLIPLIVTRWRSLLHLTRMFAFLILAVVTLTVITSVVFLMAQLLAGRTRARAVRDAALIWVANVLTFPRLPILPRVLRSADSNAAGPRISQTRLAYLSR